jgi:Zn finger protein HypA/HybF involved in hydrogenase expression
MHEVSIARALLDTVEHAAHDAGLQRVTRLNVELGEHAGVAPEALSFALELARAGTVAEGAEVIYTGPGAEEDPDHGHDHEREHSHEADEALSHAQTLENWTVRLAWIEGA